MIGVLWTSAYLVFGNRVGFFISACFYSLCRQAVLRQTKQKISLMIQLQKLSFSHHLPSFQSGRLQPCIWLNRINSLSWVPQTLQSLFTQTALLPLLILRRRHPLILLKSNAKAVHTLEPTGICYLLYGPVRCLKIISGLLQAH